MGRRRRLEPHLTVDELARRYRAAKEPHERSSWQILVALQARPDLIRSTTLFPWWPQRIKKRQGPKTTWYQALSALHEQSSLLWLKDNIVRD